MLPHRLGIKLFAVAHDALQLSVLAFVFQEALHHAHADVLLHVGDAVSQLDHGGDVRAANLGIGLVLALCPRGAFLVGHAPHTDVSRWLAPARKIVSRVSSVSSSKSCPCPAKR